MKLLHSTWSTSRSLSLEWRFGGGRQYEHPSIVFNAPASVIIQLGLVPLDTVREVLVLDWPLSWKDQDHYDIPRWWARKDYDLLIRSCWGTCHSCWHRCPWTLRWGVTRVKRSRCSSFFLITNRTFYELGPGRCLTEALTYCENMIIHHCIIFSGNSPPLPSWLPFRKG